MKRVWSVGAVAVAAFACAWSAHAATPAVDLRSAVGVYRFVDGSAAALVEQDGALRLGPARARCSSAGPVFR